MGHPKSVLLIYLEETTAQHSLSRHFIGSQSRVNHMYCSVNKPEKKHFHICDVQDWLDLFLLIIRHRSGFEEERLEGLLHKIEIQMKHQSTNFGLSLASVSSLLFITFILFPQQQGHSQLCQWHIYKPLCGRF